MRPGIGVLADSGHLPAYLHARLSSGDLEAVVVDLLSHVEIGSRGAYGREMVLEVFVERLEPVGKLHPCRSLGIQNDMPTVEVGHLIAFNTGMEQVLVSRVQRMVYLEVLGGGS